MNYKEFDKLIGEHLYKTTRKFRVASTTSSYEYQRMFKKLERNEAESLLELCEKFEEFHPDHIKLFRKIINKEIFI